MAEENEMHGFHADPGGLKRALDTAGDIDWFAAIIDKPSDTTRVTDPLSRVTTEDMANGLGIEFIGQDFMLFGLACDAAIFYSADGEYKLILGSPKFVGSCPRGSAAPPVEELRETFMTNAMNWASIGSFALEQATRAALDQALSYVKLPSAGPEAPSGTS